MEAKLYEACRENQFEEAKEILAKNPELNIDWKNTDNYYCTCLHRACGDGHLSIVPLLLAHPDINFNQKDIWGWTPFYRACNKGRTPVVQLMLKDARVLINKPADDGWTPLSAAAYSGRHEVIKWMIASGRDLDLGQPGKHSDAIGKAKANNEPEVVSLLERFKANRTQTTSEIRNELGVNDFPVDIPPKLTRQEYVDFLGGKELPVAANPARSDPLVGIEEEFYNLTAQGDFRGANELILANEGLNVNCRNRHSGRTSLHNTSDRGDVSAVQILLAHPNVDCNAATHIGSTALLLASYNGEVDVVELLVREERVDVNASDREGHTPLWYACSNGSLEIIQILIASGREIDVTTRGTYLGHKRSPKEIAEERRIQPIVSLLENFFQNPEKTRKEARRHLGMTAFSIKQHSLPWDLYREYLKDTTSSIGSVVGKQLGHSFPFFGRTTPFAFADPSEVTSLDLSFCHLSSIPDEVKLFPNLTELDISHNRLSKVMIVDFLRENRTIKTIKIAKNFSKEDANTDYISVIEAMILNYRDHNFTVEALGVDDVTLRSFDGLGVVPVDILRQGTRKIVQYVLDLYRSPNADPLYRCKLMVVGFEEIGKSTLLDCLFPMTGKLAVSNDGGNTSSPFELEIRGNVLRGVPGGEIRIGTDWKVEMREEFGENHIFLSDPDGIVLEFSPFEIGGDVSVWVQRFRDCIKRDRTHGIDLREVVYDDNQTHDYFHNLGIKGRLEVSVWDFAGQHDYYNNHHHFLSARSLFLVLWNVSEHRQASVAHDGRPIKTAEGEDLDDGNGGKGSQRKGIEGLRFWFSSLSFHLTQKSGVDKDYYSIVVVGTHADLLKGEGGFDSREKEVRDLASSFGLTVSYYIEVSCVNELTNIPRLQELVTREMLGLRCMGERIPKSYLEIEAHIATLAQTTSKQSKHLIPISEFDAVFVNSRLVRSALSLLSMWGKCVYFEDHPKLSSWVVLDPKFLTKETLAKLFQLGFENKRANGIIHHSDLKLFWPELSNRSDFDSIAPTIIGLMEMFDVCFVLNEDKDKLFFEQRSVMPGLLPVRPVERHLLQRSLLTRGKIDRAGRDLAQANNVFAVVNDMFLRGLLVTAELMADHGDKKLSVEQESQKMEELRNQESRIQQELEDCRKDWPDSPSITQTVQFERVFQFCAVPAEIVSRVISRLHRLIPGRRIFRDLVILMKGETQGRLIVDVETDRFSIDIRSPSHEEGEELLKEIKSSVEGVLSGILGSDGRQTTVVEGVKSPHSKAIISLSKFSGLSEDGKVLDSDAAVSVKYLKQCAGLIPRDTLVKKPVPRSDPKWEEVTSLFEYLGGDVDAIHSAFDIEDPRNLEAFEVHRSSLAKSHIQSPRFFKSDDYSLLSDHELRTKYLNHLKKRTRVYSTEVDLETTQVLPTAHGTNETNAWKIAESGFGRVGQLDSGYYGSGIYFTTKVMNTQHYSHPESSKLESVVVISLVNPGNTFPVTEHPVDSFPNYFGKACRIGYQSHYTVVGNTFYPLKTFGGDAWDELVVFEKAQVFPKFIVYTKKP